MMKRNLFGKSAGWLLADLVLVLAMLFLAINTAGAHPSSSLAGSPTITRAPLHLEQKFHHFTVKVNRASFLKNDAKAVASVKQQISSQPFLQGRSVGLVIAYGAATTLANCQSEGAYTVATKTYNLIQQLAKSDPVFSNAAYYDSSCKARTDVNQIIIDIYLFAQG
jgi:hypothetical protein